MEGISLQICCSCSTCCCFKGVWILTAILFRLYRSNEYIVQCTSEDDVDRWFGGAILLNNSIAILAACYQAFQARKLETEYGESRYIGYSMTIVLQMMAVTVPALSKEQKPSIRLLLVSLLQLSVSGSVLFLIFVPKVSCLDQGPCLQVRVKWTTLTVDLLFISGAQSQRRGSPPASSTPCQRVRRFKIICSTKHFTGIQGPTSKLQEGRELVGCIWNWDRRR